MLGFWMSDSSSDPMALHLGQTKHVVEGKDPSEIGNRLISPIQPAAGPVWKTMKTRMGRTENVS